MSYPTVYGLAYHLRQEHGLRPRIAHRIRSIGIAIALGWFGDGLEDAGLSNAVRAGAFQDPQRSQSLVGDVDPVQRWICGDGIELDCIRNCEYRLDRQRGWVDQAESVLLGGDVQLPLPERHVGDVVRGVPEEHLAAVRDGARAVESGDRQHLRDRVGLAVDLRDAIAIVDDVDVAGRIDRHLVGFLRL